ncbi:hypothetical protein RCR19_39795 [Streptomyces sp. WAC07094]|uniref:hypothetical protein n=1 Tax=Streptomyces sp. WAC07094 TaxID=3072183 RepID=UPI002E9AD2D5|nr:hypothetical protein [Streptomyces sp. WAC07094]
MKAIKGNETWCQVNAQVSSPTRPKRPQLPNLTAGIYPSLMADIELPQGSCMQLG